MTKSSRRRTLAAVSAASVALLTLAGCSSSSSGSGGSGSITLTEMDYYGSAPQNSQIQGVLTQCGNQVGVKVVHQEAPRAQLVPKLLQDAAARTLPDLMLVDNPDLQQLASTGGLVSLSANGLSTTGLYPSIVSAGQYQGQTYGIAPGVNDLALYYNKDLFTKAGLSAPTTWAQLTADAKTLTSGSTKGIAFSAAATEEGSFQFEPFFWSAGADLKSLDSSQAVQALTLWQSLVGGGYASKSVVNWTQSDVEAQFQAGNAAMMVNGPWQLPLLDAAKGLNFGVVSIPVPAAGQPSVSPLGGEVWSVGHSSSDREQKAVAVVKCLLTPSMSAQWSKDAGYIPSDEASAQQLATTEPQLAPFIAEVGTAKARTAELGTQYPKVSTALWDAIQQALAGGTSPQAALTQAQGQAGSGS